MPERQMISELSARERRWITGSKDVEGNYLVIKRKLIDPNCFVKSQLVENLYNTPKTFVYNMTMPLKEELELFKDDSESGSNETRVSLFGKLTDIQVCILIDNSVSPRVFSQLSPEEKDLLWQKLKSMGVDKYQFSRCV